jgi:hypothetical protein
MSRAMYGLLTTTPFRLPMNPGPLAIYYPNKIPIVDIHGDPVLDALGDPTHQAQPAIRRAEQATIDASFKREKKYWKSYTMNIRRAVFNCLDDGIDNAFNVSNDPALTGWNASMEPRDMFDQITATYGRPTPAALLQNDTLFRSKACIPHKMPPKCYVDASKIAKKYKSSERIHARRSSYSIMLFAYYCKPASTPVTSKIGIARLQAIKYGQT